MNVCQKEEQRRYTYKEKYHQIYNSEIFHELYHFMEIFAALSQYCIDHQSLQGSKGGIARNKLLDSKSRNGNHGQPSVLDLGRLHPLRVDLLQSQRIELEITGRVVLVVDLGQTVRIDGRGEEEDGGPVGRRDLAQTAVEEGGSTVGIVNEGGEVEGGGELLVEELGERPTSGGEHGEALQCVYFGNG